MLEGCLFPRPSSRAAVEIRRIVRQLDYEESQYDLSSAILISAVILMPCASHALVSRIAVIVAIATPLIDTGAHLIPYLRNRIKLHDLPLRDLLVEERKRILARIRTLTRSKNVCAALLVTGYVLGILSFGSSIVHFPLAIACMLALIVLVQLLHHFKIRKPPLARLSGIELRLHQGDAGPM